MTLETYAVTADVTARVPYRSAITISSEPSTTNVESWLREASAMLSSTLLSVGIEPPTADSGNTYTSGGQICKAWCIDYAEGRLRMAYAAAGGDGANDDGKDILQRFLDRLEWIRANVAAARALMLGEQPSSSTSQLRSLWTDDRDGGSIAADSWPRKFTRTDSW